MRRAIRKLTLPIRTLALGQKRDNRATVGPEPRPNDVLQQANQYARHERRFD